MVVKRSFAKRPTSAIIEKNPQAVRDEGSWPAIRSPFLQSFYETAVTDFTARQYAYVVPKGKM